MLVPDLRPLSVGEIIDVAIKIWRRNLSTLARIVFVVVAPVQILAALISASVSSGDIETFDAAGNSTINTGAAAAWAAGMFTAQVLSGLAFLIASAAVLRAVSVAYLGGTPDWRDSLKAATGRLRSLIWLGFLMFGGLVLAAVALIIPAIWLGVAWSVAFPVLIAEGLRGTGAMSRSFRLVKGRWWPTFGALFLAFLIQFFIGLVLGVPLGLLAVLLDSNSVVALVLGVVINVLSSVITTPFMAAVLILIYFDLRVRKEGFDLQLLSQGVGLEGDVLPAAAPWLVGGGASGGHWGDGGSQWGGANWGGTSEAWPTSGGDWPAPTGPPASGYPAPGGYHSGWAPPGAGMPAGDPPTGPPQAPRFEEPIDPTGAGDAPEAPGDREQ